MAYEVKNQLLAVKPYYEVIEQHSNQIRQKNGEISTAQSKLSQDLKDDKFIPNQFEKAEKARQEKAEKEAEKKFGSTVLPWICMMGLFYFLCLSAQLLNSIILGLVLTFALLLIILFIANKVKSPAIERNKFALESAKEKDKEAQENYDRRNAEYKVENANTYHMLKQKYPPEIQQHRKEIDIQLAQADMILRLPEGYRTLAAVNEMLRRYEDCCEHLHGKDPTSIRQLIDFCKLTKCRENGESIMRQLKFDQQAKERQRQEDAHRRRMSEEWQTQSGLNQKTEELNRARKEIEEIKKELES